jgi:hypothetical protein
VPVLEAGERRLRTERFTLERITVQEQQLGGIEPQAGRVVAVLVTAGDAVHALPHEVEMGVPHSAGIAVVGQRRS